MKWKRRAAAAVALTLAMGIVHVVVVDAPCMQVGAYRWGTLLCWVCGGSLNCDCVVSLLHCAVAAMHVWGESCYVTIAQQFSVFPLFGSVGCAAWGTICQA